MSDDDSQKTMMGVGDAAKQIEAAKARALRTEISPRPKFAQAQDEPGTARTQISGPPVAARNDAARTEISAPPNHQAESPAAAPNTNDADNTGADELQLSQGAHVAQFELIRELGRGGMGAVYLARDTKLGRLVALKFLNIHSPELTERFLVEARATAQCNHQNIVVIYEADEWQGQPYMALEYLEGAALSGLLANDTTLTPRRVVELIVPVVRALVRAHQLDIVHRDLKPDNIFVTDTGIVKVLDFGIAKLFQSDEQTGALTESQVAKLSASNMTQEGALIGTMPYMSPEQWGADKVDHSTDIWAIGIILWEMLTARHPLEPVTPQRLWHAAAHTDQPMPSIATAAHDLPEALERIIDRCLAKGKQDRFASAQELLEAIEPLVPGRFGRRLEQGESPFPGMSAFQETDADRFFGRSRDIAHMVQRMRDQPLVGVVGLSGVGKSSFVRAGVVPALKASGESWQTLVTRPGRDPMAGLASLLQPMLRSTATDLDQKMAEHQALLDRLRQEPGYLGTLLRSRARQKKSSLLLFVDQFEELYTLVPDQAERLAYTACLAGVADDASTPLRVVVSMRSDFLDRAAEDRAFMDRLTRGLLFLPPVDRAGMREALLQPLDMVGYGFESEAIIDDMLSSLADSQGALPLLQFTAAKLWDSRDHSSRRLTSASYEAMGGLEGALATHADDVVSRLPTEQQRLTRAVFLRLVTRDGTRAIVDVEELRELGEPSTVSSLLDHLVQARLLVVQSRGEQEGPAVEIVHESLTTRWPTLRRWLDESSEDSAFLEQLRTAAKQWAAKGKPIGMLWRGEAMVEAQRFERRYKGELPGGEREYLGAVTALALKTTRRRRRILVGSFAVLLVMVAAAAVALIWVRDAEQTARNQKNVAQNEADRARKAEVKVKTQLSTIKSQIDTITRKESQRAKAEDDAEKATAKAEKAKATADKATAEAATGEKKLKRTYEQLETALRKAQRAKARAEKDHKRAEAVAKENKKLAAAQREANKKTERLLRVERARVKTLKAEKRKLSTKLK